MIAETINKSPELNGDDCINRIQSRAPEVTEPATVAGFSFLRTYRDTMGTQNNISYKKAKLYDQGSKWFVYYHYWHEGKFHRFKVYEGLNRIKDPLEKRLFAKQLIEAINYGLSVGHNPFKQEFELVKKDWSLIQALNYFKQKMPDLGLRKKTTNGYSSMLSILVQGLKPIHNSSIESISKNQFHAFLDREASARNWSNTTYNNMLTFGRLLFSFFIQNSITTLNPFKQIKPLPEIKSRNQPFDNQTFERIKKNASPELLRYILFLYHTGVRPNEARQLSYEHILRDRKLLLIPAGMSKNKKDGYVPVSDQFLEMFQGEGKIFKGGKTTWENKFAKLKKELKLPANQNLYSIKATRAVHLAEAGANPYAIMQLFRHSSLDITMSYLRGLGLSVGREAAEKGLRM